MAVTRKRILIGLTPLKFRELLKRGYSTDILYLLTLCEKGLDVRGFSEPKENAIIQSLYRKQLINEEGSLLPEGKKLLDYIRAKDEEGEKLELPERIKNTCFDEWWATYPGTDTLIVGGKIVYRGSRSLRNNKDKCRVLYNKIIDTKEYTHQQMVGALKKEIELKISRSLREKKNTLCYMKNTFSYLTQRSFEDFIELSSIEPATQPAEDEGSFTL